MGISALLLIASAVTVLADVATPVTADEHARDVLGAELQRRYPGVQRWEIETFDEGRVSRVTGRARSNAAPTRVDVVRVGARSAVRVGAHLQWYAVSGYRDVMSATRRIGALEQLDASSARREERDVLAIACDPLTNAMDLEGMRARRRIQENEILCRQSVEPRPTVARGDTVTVRYVGERIELVTKGIARSEGFIGDTLSVQGLKSKDAFAALVSGVGEVTIHE